MQEELSAYVQVPQGRGLLDISQLHDAISWVALGEQALEAGFPAEVLNVLRRQRSRRVEVSLCQFNLRAPWHRAWYQARELPNA